MNIETPTSAMTDQDIRAAIGKAMVTHPGLCANGIYRMPLGRRRAYGEPLPDQFPEWQQQLATALDEVRQALTYLDECKPHKTFACSSYGLKHRAENLFLYGKWWDPEHRYPLPVTHRGYWTRHYVSNGSMICACIIRGIPLQMYDDGPNCDLALQEPKPCRRPHCPHWLPAETAKQICETCRAGVQPDPEAAPKLVQVPAVAPTTIPPRHMTVGVMDCEAINDILNHRHWGAMQWEGNRTLVLRPNAVLPTFPLAVGMRVDLWPWVLAQGLGLNVRAVNPVLQKAWDERDRVYMGLAAEPGEFCDQVDGWVADLVDPNIPRSAWSWGWAGYGSSMRNPRGNWTTSRVALPIVNTHSNQDPADLPEGWGPDWAFGLRHERGEP